jgi:uncharacterized membrane protein
MEPLPRFVPPDRAISFSDGVFAVVITVLVLGIAIPSDTVLVGRALAVERGKLLHQLLIYVVAFWMVAMYWSQHSLFFSGLEQIDRGVFVLNLLFLLPVTLLPFVTQLMGAKRDDWKVVLVFGINNLLVALVLERMWSRIAAVPEAHKSPQTAMLATRIRVGVRVYEALMILGVLIARLDVPGGNFVVHPHSDRSFLQLPPRSIPVALSRTIFRRTEVS